MPEAELLDQALARVPYARSLGITRSDTGGALRLPCSEHIVGNARLPAIHGGVIAGFAETTAMLWLLCQAPGAPIPQPVDFAIDYLRSARAGEDTFAACEVLHQGRRVAQVSVRVWQSDPERLTAFARVHMLLRDGSSSA